MDLTSTLDRLRSKEDSRPYYHYQNLFHDPRGLSAGESINPSPLARETGDPLIAVHFQVDGAGRLSIPPINEELQQFSDASKLVENTKLLRQLRSAKGELLGPGKLVAVAEPRQNNEPQVQQAVPMQSQMQAPTQQAQFSNQAFAQNAAPNAVFMELESKSGKRPKPTKKGGLQAAEQPIEVLTHGFIWKAATIDEETELVAIRRVETPVGNLRQGFLIGAKEVRAWLAQRSAVSSNLSLLQDSSRSQPSEVSNESVQRVPVPALDSWFLVMDIGTAQAAADAKAASLQAAFLWRFGPTTAISALLLGMLIMTVARAERLARERSQFAAAAAHELRTPLAGLQLYGDMLADGLGDQSAKEKYARHISDEAQRLGRVVSNVLGLSQMERSGISLHCKEASLSDATRQIVERIRPPLETAGMTLELAIERDVDAVFDEDALSRILQNLLDNAEKYSREQDERQVRVAVEKGSGLALVRVADSGPGLSRPMRQQVFKPFRRHVDEDGPAGLGLGLALARALARQQDGDLRLEDSLLGGICFVLELPAAT